MVLDSLPNSLAELGSFLISSQDWALLKEINEMLVDLKEQELFRVEFRLLRVVLLALIYRGQAEGVHARKGDLLKSLQPHKFPAGQFEFAKRMGQYALKIYDVNWKRPSEWIVRKLGLPSGDDVMFPRTPFTDDTSNVSAPNYLVLIDHEAESVILVVRGTHEFKDVLIDLAGEDEEFLDGHAHMGILKGALKILKESKQDLKELLVKHPKYKFVITGHSLGAGTAILATLQVLLGPDKFVAANRVKCIALAPPPVFRSEVPIPAEVAEKIEIFIHRHDCVPSLSVGVYTKLVAAMKEVDDLDLSLLSVPLVIHHPNNPLSFSALNSIQDAISSVTAEVPLLKHPAQVYYFHQKDNQDYEIFKLDGAFFSDELMLQLGMVLDHMQDNYQKAFDAIGPDQLIAGIDE